MTMVVPLNDAARRMAEDLVSEGRFATIEEAVEAGLARLSDEIVDIDDLPPEHRAAVLEGLADIEAGRTYPAEEVFDELLAKYKAMAKRR